MRKTSIKPTNKSRGRKRVRYRDPGFLAKLGRRIRRVRLSKGYSIDRLSLESDHLSRATISRIESGKADPQLSTIQRIADCLEVTLSFLVDLTRDR